jgi:hypothetical protein
MYCWTALASLASPGPDACGGRQLEVTGGEYRLEPRRIQLRGVRSWEEYDVVVYDTDKPK